MEARFFCRTGALAGADHRIGGKATIGRGRSNTIVIADSAVSKTHARIAFDPATAAWVLEDLDSTNGTRLDGAPVSGREPLRDLHVVTLGGHHDFIFVALPAGAGLAAGAPAPSRATARPPDSPGAAAGTPYERPAAAAGPPLVSGSSPAPADAGDSSGAEAGTRHEQPPALSVPPLVSGSSPAPADAGDSSGAEAGTRHEQPPALSVPPLVSGSPAPADAGDSPSVAGARFGPGPATGARRPDRATAAPREPAPGPAASPPADEASPPGVVFEVRPAGGEARRVRLGDGGHVFGRAKGCAVPIDDSMLSRRHAAFAVRGERVTVVDLGSLNGTFVDGARIGVETEVGVGGIVGLGEAVTIVRVAP